MADDNKNFIPDEYEPTVTAIIHGVIGTLGAVGSYFQAPWMALVIAGITGLAVALRLMKKKETSDGSGA